jgi:hypothetical protein
MAMSDKKVESVPYPRNSNPAVQAMNQILMSSAAVCGRPFKKRRSMKVFYTIILVLSFQFLNAQVLTFSDTNLKWYLLNENSVDVDGDEIADTTIDLNNDGEIQVSEAQLVENLVIAQSNGALTITSIADIQQFSNLKRLTIYGDFGLTEISNLGIAGLEFIRVSDHTSITGIDLSDLPNLSGIILEGLTGVQYLNLQNGSYASEDFSLFYTYVQYACVDTISDEYDYVSTHLFAGGSIHTNCTLGITTNEGLEIEIFPNPTSDKIRFGKEIESAVLYNLNGQILNEWNLPTSAIDISDLSRGVYVLLISIDNTILRQRIVKR